MTDQVSIFSVDVLPAKCGVESQIAMGRRAWYVRFRAERYYGFRHRKIKRSAWTDWQIFTGEIVPLKWDDLWKGEVNGK